MKIDLPDADFPRRALVKLDPVETPLRDRLAQESLDLFESVRPAEGHAAVILGAPSPGWVPDAIGQWTAIVVEGQEHLTHLEVKRDGRYVATIWRVTGKSYVRGEAEDGITALKLALEQLVA